MILFEGRINRVTEGRFQEPYLAGHTAPVDRQRQYAVFGCIRSAEVLSLSKLATCERLLSLSLTFSAA